MARQNPDTETEARKEEKSSLYLRMQVPSHPRYVNLIRDIVYNFCREHEISRARSFEVKVVCGEALNNIIEHVYEGRTDRPVFLGLYAYSSFVEMRIRDLGEQKPITSDMARDLSDYRERGLGLFLIGKLSDYHYFDQSGERGTQLIVKKRIQDPTSS